MARERDNRKLTPNATVRWPGHLRSKDARTQLIYYRKITAAVPPPNGRTPRLKIADGYPS